MKEKIELSITIEESKVQILEITQKMGYISKETPFGIDALQDDALKMSFSFEEGDNNYLVVGYIDEQDFIKYNEIANQMETDQKPDDNVATKQEEIKEEQTKKTKDKSLFIEKTKRNKKKVIIGAVILIVVAVAAVIIGLKVQEEQRLAANIENLEKAQASYDAGYYSSVDDSANLVINNQPTEEQKTKAEELIKNAKQKQEEKEKKEKEEQKKKRKAQIQNTIQITGLWTSAPDSADGVAIYFNFINKSSKTIKYVNFGVELHNAVGDVVTGKYSTEKIQYCQDTGPYGPGKGRQGTDQYWGKIYNSTITSAKLVNLSVEFTDGSTVTAADAEEAQWAIY